MDRKRGVHPSRAGLPRYAVAGNGHAGNGNASSDEDDLEVSMNPPVQRASARRQHRVDFSKLETASLKRYRKVYKLGDMATNAKEELIPAIARHFAQTVVDEEDTLGSLRNLGYHISSGQAHSRLFDP
ncbi:hypothetical protein WJX72_011056 [[Myrmecia] bisecta]|uniref:Histone deacetylase complex subunit SAP30 Sin3 binding domain-containing protein n=1 Tax=[Myrmecia] bisecta TaxID=41462 RepID=A0AAW1PQC7_9CHLO